MNIYCFSTLSFAKLQFKSVINKAFHKHGVASFTDAWIETAIFRRENHSHIVASFTDAWIETSSSSSSSSRNPSHLLPMRGLKLKYLFVVTFARKVASFTDAWIETALRLNDIYFSMSHLLQMRGLKRLFRWNSRHIWSRIFYRCVDWNV